MARNNQGFYAFLQVLRLNTKLQEHFEYIFHVMKCIYNIMQQFTVHISFKLFYSYIFLRI